MDKESLKQISDMMGTRLQTMEDKLDAKFDITNKEVSEVKKICLDLDKSYHEMERDIGDIRQSIGALMSMALATQGNVNSLSIKFDNFRISFEIMNEEFRGMREYINRRTYKLEQVI